MAGGGGQQGDDKNSMQILWIIFGVFFICGAIWWGFSKELKEAFIFIKYWELQLLYWLFQFFGLTVYQMEVQSTLVKAAHLNQQVLTVNSALELTTMAGKFWRFPIVIFILAGCYYFYARNVKVRYKKRYSMKSLIEQEKNLWPQVEVVSKLNLVEEDLDKGPWAMAQTPMIFSKANDLLEIAVDITIGYGSQAKFTAKLNKKKTDAVFSNQLGRLWRGPERLAPHRKALFAAFIARSCRDTKASHELVARLNKSIGAGKTPDYSNVDELIKKHFKDRTIQEICSSHAYETTVITSILLCARQDGVVPSADFLWLKPLDRRFWYTLNNVGRQTPCTEAAGIFAHWLAEKHLGRPLSVPFIQEATKALEKALVEIIYVPTPEEKEQLLKKAREEGKVA